MVVTSRPPRPASRRRLVAGQVGGADEPRLVAQPGRDDLRLGAVATSGEPTAEVLTCRAEQQLAGRGHATADDEGAGVERCREVGDADAEPVADLGEQLRGGGVTVAGGLGDDRTGELVSTAVDAGG